MRPRKYYEAFEVADGWKGRVYGYDKSGNRPQVIWKSTETFHTREEALDAACTWCEEHDIEAEMG